MDHARHEIRPGLTRACARAWQRIARPGTWWTGTERVAIAAETRNAARCSVCAQQRASLSPAGVTGPHEGSTELPLSAVEAVHRIRNDSGRLTEAWFLGVTGNGLDEAAYVEIVGVVATTIALDTFARALGEPPDALPPPQPGTPKRHRPRRAVRQIAWVATLSPQDVAAEDPDPYPGKAPEHAMHIHQALSLVPAETAGFFDLDEELYLPQAAIRDFDSDHRAISHPQMELIAARLSAINQCTY